MKSFAKIATLSCLLSLFVFGELAEGQPPWRRVRQDPNLEPAGRSQPIPRQSTQPQSFQSSPPVQTPPQRPVQPQPYQSPNNYGNTWVPSQRFRLEPGDVILEINGEWIDGQEDVTSAIARSPQTMYLTVLNGRNGTTARYVTTLDSRRPRFGVSHQTHPGGGSRITGVNRNSPATRCYRVE